MTTQDEITMIRLHTDLRQIEWARKHMQDKYPPSLCDKMKQDTLDAIKRIEYRYKAFELQGDMAQQFNEMYDQDTMDHCEL